MHIGPTISTLGEVVYLSNIVDAQYKETRFEETIIIPNNTGLVFSVSGLSNVS
jgi:hypothetical protein